MGHFLQVFLKDLMYSCLFKLKSECLRCELIIYSGHENKICFVLKGHSTYQNAKILLWLPTTKWVLVLFREFTQFYIKKKSCSFWNLDMNVWPEIILYIEAGEGLKELMWATYRPSGNISVFSLMLHGTSFQPLPLLCLLQWFLLDSS